jgi:L-amino acid N-acyltransferase YncA
MSDRKEGLHEITERLGQLGYTLDPYEPRDQEGLYQIFQGVVEAGSLFPYESSSLQDFHQLFLKGKVYVCRSSSREVVGGFYIRPNFPGRSSHIANAAYMLGESYRNRGIGSLLIKASLLLAKELGFQAMQYNMVLSQNRIAVRLYQKLGFQIIGTLPEAVRNPDGSYQDGYLMYQKLNTL